MKVKVDFSDLKGVLKELLEEQKKQIALGIDEKKNLELIKQIIEREIRAETSDTTARRIADRIMDYLIAMGIKLVPSEKSASL